MIPIESMRLRRAIACQIGRPILGPQNSLGKLALENNWTQFDWRCIELWCYKITLTLMTTTMKCCWVNKNRVFFDFWTSRWSPSKMLFWPPKTLFSTLFRPKRRCFIRRLFFGREPQKTCFFMFFVSIVFIRCYQSRSKQCLVNVLKHFIEL